MSTDTVIGEGRDLGGKIEEGIGNATGDTELQATGVADQLRGNLQKTFGETKDKVGPLVDQAKQFAKDRPWATAALLGTIGIALINTLRGKSVRK
ncbi:MAG: CsbD family protein [Sphingomonas sp.]